MAPFLVAHPMLLHRWMTARETALARVLAGTQITAERRAGFFRLILRAIAHVAEWHTDDVRQRARSARLKNELEDLAVQLTASDSSLLSGLYPWRALSEQLAETGSEELQELANSLLIELYPELADDLADAMADPEEEVFQPALPLAGLKTLIEQHYDWALNIDFTCPEAQHYFWYRSAEKEEPRLGERHSEPGAELEMRLGIARDVQTLYQLLNTATEDPTQPVAAFLLRQPQWRFIVRRIQLVARYPYAEIRDNLLAADCLPIDMLRCKLSFFGAFKFDPKSDRWTRITMYQGAPAFAELDDANADDWFLPVFLQSAPGDSP
jgi:hypothetical protein